MDKKINEKQEFSSEEIKEMYKKAKEAVGGYGLKTFERALEIYQQEEEMSEEELKQVAGGVNRKTLSLALAGIAAIAAGFGIAGTQQVSASNEKPSYSTAAAASPTSQGENFEIQNFKITIDRARNIVKFVDEAPDLTDTDNFAKILDGIREKTGKSSFIIEAKNLGPKMTKAEMMNGSVKEMEGWKLTRKITRLECTKVAPTVRASTSAAASTTRGQTTSRASLGIAQKLKIEDKAEGDNIKITLSGRGDNYKSVTKEEFTELLTNMREKYKKDKVIIEFKGANENPLPAFCYNSFCKKMGFKFNEKPIIELTSENKWESEDDLNFTDRKLTFNYTSARASTSELKINIKTGVQDSLNVELECEKSAYSSFNVETIKKLFAEKIFTNELYKGQKFKKIQIKLPGIERSKLDEIVKNLTESEQGTPAIVIIGDGRGHDWSYHGGQFSLKRETLVFEMEAESDERGSDKSENINPFKNIRSNDFDVIEDDMDEKKLYNEAKAKIISYIKENNVLFYQNIKTLIMNLEEGQINKLIRELTEERPEEVAKRIYYNYYIALIYMSQPSSEKGQEYIKFLIEAFDGSIEGGIEESEHLILYSNIAFIFSRLFREGKISGGPSGDTAKKFENLAKQVNKYNNSLSFTEEEQENLKKVAKKFSEIVGLNYMRGADYDDDDDDDDSEIPLFNDFSGFKPTNDDDDAVDLTSRLAMARDDDDDDSEIPLFNDFSGFTPTAVLGDVTDIDSPKLEVPEGDLTPSAITPIVVTPKPQSQVAPIVSAQVPTPVREDEILFASSKITDDGRNTYVDRKKDTKGKLVITDAMLDDAAKYGRSKIYTQKTMAELDCSKLSDWEAKKERGRFKLLTWVYFERKPGTTASSSFDLLKKSDGTTQEIVDGNTFRCYKDQKSPIYVLSLQKANGDIEEAEFLSPVDLDVGALFDNAKRGLTAYQDSFTLHGFLKNKPYIMPVTRDKNGVIRKIDVCVEDTILKNDSRSWDTKTIICTPQEDGSLVLNSGIINSISAQDASPTAILTYARFVQMEMEKPIKEEKARRQAEAQRQAQIAEQQRRQAEIAAQQRAAAEAQRPVTLVSGENYDIMGLIGENREIQEVRVRLSQGGTLYAGFLRLEWSTDGTEMRIWLSGDQNFERNSFNFIIGKPWPGFNQSAFMQACGEVLRDNFIGGTQPNIEAIAREAYNRLVRQAPQARAAQPQTVAAPSLTVKQAAYDTRALPPCANMDFVKGEFTKFKSALSRARTKTEIGRLWIDLRDTLSKEFKTVSLGMIDRSTDAGLNLAANLMVGNVITGLGLDGADEPTQLMAVRNFFRGACTLASEMNTLFPDGKIPIFNQISDTDQLTQMSWSCTRRQAACLISGALFAMMSPESARQAVASELGRRGQKTGDSYKHVFDLGQTLLRPQVSAGIINYLDFIFNVIDQGDPNGFLREQITFRRNNAKVDINAYSALPLCNVEFGGYIETHPNTLQCDFANKGIGGGVLGARGSVQEELRFGNTSPECLVSILLARLNFVSLLNDCETITIEGACDYGSYTGYKESARFAGRKFDRTARAIVAMDAVKRPGIVAEAGVLFERDVNKAFVGFSADPRLKDVNVSTGAWGCGDFQNNKGLKFIEQWIACSMAGNPDRKMYYCAGADEKIVLEQITRLGITKIGQMRALVKEYSNQLRTQPGLPFTTFLQYHR